MAKNSNSMFEELHFLLSNRIPRRWATLLFARFSKLENRLLARISIAVWRRIAPDLDLSEAKKQNFNSIHDCFIRELRPGIRPLDPDPDIIISPCDAIVGTFGAISGTEVLQTKGSRYSLYDLLADQQLVDRYRDGTYITMRLTPTMYHRFHAPCDCHVSEVTYISGDTWNVNPVTLKRIERLFCKNERAVIKLELKDSPESITLVPVAAILVASMRFHFINQTLNLKYRGPNQIRCNADLTRGEEMGYFEHGSTIIVFASSGFSLCDDVTEGKTIRMGEKLLKTTHNGGAM
jgi:phosphatidylserine decarboxylase